MENLVITHKKLQLNLFYAFTRGITDAMKLPKGCFFTVQATGEYFGFEIWRSATAPENGDAEPVLSYKINKEVNQMNDIRPGVIVEYMSQQFFDFKKKVDDLFQSTNSPA
jgi:hypothetical protein